MDVCNRFLIDSKAKGSLGSTGNTLMRRTTPLMRGAYHPPDEASFHFASRLQKNQNRDKRQWCLWRCMCPLSMHQFIEISICAFKEKKKFKHFNVERPVKVCVLTGVSRAPPPKLQGELCLQVSFWNQGLFPCNPDHPRSVPRSSRRCEVNNC